MPFDFADNILLHNLSFEPAEVAAHANASGDESLAETIYSNLLYGGSEVARMLTDVVRNFHSNNHATAWTSAEILIHPAHVIQELPDNLVATATNLKLDDQEALALIDCQKVNKPAVNRVLDAVAVVRFVDP
jgi:N12 class adenine-specific DNA methylase